MPATLAVPYAVASRLSCIQGTLAGQVFLLAGGNLTVGREPSCSIAILGDSQVSRTHARVSQEGSSWVLYDTGSSNGTFANTIRVTRHELQTGDTIQFGQCVFRVE